MPRPVLAPTPTPVMASHLGPGSIPGALTPSSGESAGSPDVRVKAWLDRFGGAGSVRVGAPQPGAALDEASLLAELNAQEAAAAAGADDTWPPRKHTARASAAAPPPRPRRANGAYTVPLVAIAVVAALGMLVFAQRQTIGRMVTAALAETHPPTQAEKPVVQPVRPAPPKAPAAQFSIASGRYGTRDLARAEADYLGRLISPSVRVGNLRDGEARLLIGRYDTREQARSAMAGLQNRGLIPDASVIEVPPLEAKPEGRSEPTGG